MNEHSELLIHGKDGQIQERNTNKTDPYPPRPAQVRKARSG
jgi:hypothetical protein